MRWMVSRTLISSLAASRYLSTFLITFRATSRAVRPPPALPPRLPGSTRVGERLESLCARRPRYHNTNTAGTSTSTKSRFTSASLHRSRAAIVHELELSAEQSRAGVRRTSECEAASASELIGPQIYYICQLAMDSHALASRLAPRRIAMHYRAAPLLYSTRTPGSI